MQSYESIDLCFNSLVCSKLGLLPMPLHVPPQGQHAPSIIGTGLDAIEFYLRSPACSPTYLAGWATINN